MKISRIKISKFYQFEDFELDLTYPKGHEKEGKPLDKVCLIGQSGTGKTTLLEMIRGACLYANSPRSNHQFFKLHFEPQKGVGAYFLFQGGKGEEDFHITLDATGAGMNVISQKPVSKALFYFSTGLAQAELKEDLINPSETHHVEESAVDYKVEQEGMDYYPITPKTIQAIWNGVYKYIVEFQKSEASFRINLTRRIEKEKLSVDVVKELQDWRTENPNPLEKIAKECLNIILNRFHLTVETEIEDIRQINALQIRSLSDSKTIPYEKLSTGTKQIIFTAFPIYQLLQEESIVLMDEPETSLYPDIQRELVPYYTSFDKEKKSQFFFATHSPVIASSFEPWEIVELKFDEKGKVYRDKYYEGENHVDNYKIDPRYLRWDDILTKVFDLPVDSNAEYRSKKLTEYSILKNKIKTMREKGELDNPSKETRDVVAEFEKAYDLLTGNWEVTRHEKN